MQTTTRLGRLAGAGAFAALLFTAACDSGESTAPTGLEPPEVGFNRTDPFVQPGVIYVCQETPSPDDVGHYSYVVGGDSNPDGTYGFPVAGDNTETGELELTGSVFDDGDWSGNPAESDACAPITAPPVGTFVVTLKTPATFGHEDGVTNPNRWAYGEGRFGGFLFGDSHRSDLDCDRDGVIGDPSGDGLATLEGECPLRLANAESGAIVWYKFEPDDTPPPPTGIEGCTPGAWRNQDGTGRNGRNRWTGTPYDLETTFEEVFGEGSIGDADLTLREALDYNSNSGGQALLKHAAAAALNAAHEDVDYPYTLEMVVEMFNEAWADLEGDNNETKDLFDVANNLGCPI